MFKKLDFFVWVMGSRSFELFSQTKNERIFEC